MSTKHLHRYVMEFEGRHNSRPMDTARPDERHRLPFAGEAVAVSRLGGINLQVIGE